MCLLVAQCNCPCLQELKGDAIKEQQLLKKLSPGEERGPSQSVLASSPQFGLAIEFERCDHIRRFRLFLREILGVLRQLDPPASVPFKFVQSDLFECEVHIEEICDIMCIAAAGIVDDNVYVLGLIWGARGCFALHLPPPLLLGIRFSYF